MSWKREGRGMRSLSLILVGAVAGAMMLTPAFAGPTDPVTNKKFKKVVKKLKKKDKNLQTQITGLPTTSAVQQSIDASIGKVINLFGSSYVRATATPGPDAATARMNAPKIPLLTQGPFSIYGKCFSYPADTVAGEVYIETSANGTIFDSSEDFKFGGSLATEFLNTSTAEVDRQLEIETAGANLTAYTPGDAEYSAMAPNGTALDGVVQVALKNGTLTEGNGVYGDGDVCLFAGFTAGN